MSDITYKMLPMPAVLMMVAQVPNKIVDQMNNYLDNLLLQEDRKSSAHTLVGQISAGEQLFMDHKSKELTEVRFFLQDIAIQYVLDFFHSTGQELDGGRHVEIDELWSVHSYAGDYNPMHEHGTVSGRGVSIIVFLKVPPQIKNKGTPTQTKNSGRTDGVTQFIWDMNSSYDAPRFKHPTYAHVYPEVGKICVFPIWLHHQVSPFFGDGERRTMSCNIDIINYA